MLALTNALDDNGGTTSLSEVTASLRVAAQSDQVIVSALDSRSDYDDGSGSPNSQARRRSSFLVDSPLQKASSKKSLVDATSSSSVNTGKSGPARRRQSLSKMTSIETNSSIDHVSYSRWTT